MASQHHVEGTVDTPETPDSSGLTSGEIAELKAILAEHRSGGDRVTGTECAAIRRRVRTGEEYTEIAADPDVTAGCAETVTHHARGKCTHAPDEPPVTSGLR